MVAVAEVVAVTEEILAAEAVAVIEETLAAHVKVVDTEATLAVAHAMAVVTKVQTHVMAEAEMHVLQEAMAFLEVTAEARVVTHLQKREAVQLHAKAADTKAIVTVAIADHHALQEPTDQAHHAVTQVALQKPLLVTLTKKINF